MKFAHVLHSALFKGYQFMAIRFVVSRELISKHQILNTIRLHSYIL